LNANELAYEWEHTAFISEESKQECGNKMATMLRQQQAEIEELKSKYRQEFEYVEKKFSDEWWQGVAEYNKGKAQEK
jgi:hypothetical protein